MNTSQWSYFAALIDGEGHVGNPKQGLHISTVTKELSFFLKKEIGGKVFRWKNKRGYKNPYDWKISAKELVKISNNFKRFLIIKRENIELWREWIKLPISVSNQYISNRHPRRQKILDRLKCLTTRSKSQSNNLSNSEKPQTGDAVGNSDPSFQSKEEKYAYLAGIIDGEGSIHIRTLRKNTKRKYQFLPDIVVANTDSRIIDWLYNNFGGRKSIRESDNKNWKDRYYWFSNSRQVPVIMDYISPYVIIKKPHLKQLKKFYNLPHYKHPKDVTNRSYLTDNGFKRAKRIVATISILNHKKSLLLNKGATTLKGDSKEKIESRLMRNHKK